MGDLDFVIFVKKSDNCKRLLEIVDERLTTYNNRGIRIFIKKVNENNMPDGVVNLPTCYIRGRKAEGVSAIIKAFNSLCKPKKPKPKDYGDDEVANFMYDTIGGIDETKKDAEGNESAVGEDDVDLDSMMSRFRAESAIRDKKVKPEDDLDNVDISRNKKAPKKKSRSKPKSKPKKVKFEDEYSSDADSDNSDYDQSDEEPEDNIRSEPEDNFDLEQEMKKLIYDD